MGKYDKKQNNDFADIQAVFQKRDRGRGAQTQASRNDPEVPAFMNDPGRIRGDGGYSVEAMRQVHERQTRQGPSGPVVVSHDRRGVSSPGEDELRYSNDRFRQSAPSRGAWEAPPLRGAQQAYGAPPRSQGPQARGRRRKKHRVLRFFLGLAGAFLILLVLFGVGSALFAKMPDGSDSPARRKDGCCTVLLCGTDKDGDRTDTMLLLFLDRPNRQMRLMSLPRDTMVNRTSSVPKLNGAYGANGKGEQGMDVLMGYVKDLVGFRPDGYMLIDLNCFEELVDLMGGVTYDVPMDMAYEDPSQDLFIDLKAGTQKLNGKQAMWLVRFRSGYAMADLERVKVQRSFLAEALSQWSSPGKVLRLPWAMRLLLANTQTDLSYRNLCWIGITAAKCSSAGFESDTLPGEPAWVKGGSYYVQDRVKTAALINQKYNPFKKEISANELHPYGY